MKPLHGVYNILSTPVDRDGELDIPSLRRLTDATIGMGVDGITVLGVAGEAHKLREDQRRELIATVMDVSQGRVPIIVGASRDGTSATITAAREARAAGAAGVMIAPPTFLQPGPVLTKHFQAVSNAVDLPIVLQDYPAVNGVTMTPRAMADLANTVENIVTIKLEDLPTPQRMAQTSRLLEGDVSIMGGLGGMYLLDEMRNGGVGTMTGFAYPEVLVDIVARWNSGDRAGATDVFYRYLPLLVFEGTPKIGVAIRKETLRRRGLIDHADLVPPGAPIDADTAAALTATLQAVNIDDAVRAGLQDTPAR